jgi:rare lipoprotein A
MLSVAHPSPWRTVCLRGGASVVWALLLVWGMGLTGCASKPVALPASMPSSMAQLPAPMASRAPSDVASPATLPATGDALPNLSQVPVNASTGWQEAGLASWYGPGFHGKRTANGERFNTHALTAAHKTLPFGTRVRVKSMVNGKEVVVRINDRGPFIKGRIIDLSRAAALALGLTGVKRVELERLQ